MAALVEERKRLDALLDDALEQYALYEEGMNARMKGAAPDVMAQLMAERAGVEETLGIADLVERLDQIRDRMTAMKAIMGGA